MSRLIEHITANVAAISASVHRHRRYMELYQSTAIDISGFPGIWQLCAEIGTAFTDAELDGRHLAGETYEWIDAIEEMTKRVFEVCIDGDGPYSVNWCDEATASIKQHSFPPEGECRRYRIEISCIVRSV